MTDIAVIYVRNSTGEQSSIDNQIEACQNYANRKNMRVLETYIENDDFSIQINRLLEDAKTRNFQHVIITQLNRISRRSNVVLETINLLENNDIKIHSLEEKAPNPSILDMFQALQNYETHVILDRQIDKVPVQNISA